MESTVQIQLWKTYWRRFATGVAAKETLIKNNWKKVTSYKFLCQVFVCVLWQVRYWEKSKKNEVSKQRISSSVNWTRLDNLKPDTHYVIEVQAFNGPEFGPASQQHEIHTEKARKPLFFQVTCMLYNTTQ